MKKEEKKSGVSFSDELSAQGQQHILDSNAV